MDLFQVDLFEITSNIDVAVTNATDTDASIDAKSMISEMDSNTTYATDSNMTDLTTMGKLDLNITNMTAIGDMNMTNNTKAKIEGQGDTNSTKIILQAMQGYGSIYVIFVLIFCILRQRRNKFFNIRSWAPEHECQIASKEYGFFSWIWEVFDVSEDDILDQCGMDALCFIRILRFGRKIALFSCFHALWLIPVYGTAQGPEISQHVPDLYDILSTANLPKYSPRFIGTIIAAYMIFFYTMRLILEEFEWYTEYRHKFLMQSRPRNYAVYVSGIPEDCRSNYALLEYFRLCASPEKVVDAQIAKDLPKLESQVARREAVVGSLEHEYASQQIHGTRSKKTKIGLRGLEQVDQIESLENELDELNKEIGNAINETSRADSLAGMQHINKSTIFGNRSGISRQIQGFCELPSGDNEEGKFLSFDEDDASNISKESDVENQGSSMFFSMYNGLRSSLPFTSKNQKDSANTSKLDEALSEDDDQSFFSAKLGDVIEEENSQSIRSDTDHMTDSKRNRFSSIFDVGNKLKTAVQETKIGKVGGTVTKQVANVGELGAQRITQSGAETFRNATDIGAGLVTAASAIVPLKFGKEEGRPREAGFVVFTDLYTTHSALQMLHHPKPFVMEVSEAPDPEDIFWPNVGLPAEAKRTGKLMSMAATTMLCFFWTVPVGFISGLTEIEDLKQSVPFLEDMVRIYPNSEMLLAQVAPIMLVVLNSVVLPGALKHFAQMEGHVANPALESSFFVKFSAFMIIQTFFVSAISGGIYSALKEMASDFGKVIDVLASSLPTQSSYFLQILLVDVFFVQAFELLRVVPLGMALVRRRLGPNLTEKERESPYNGIHPLSNPPEFSHAEVLAPMLFYFMVLFVYASISPVINFFLVLAFLLQEVGARYQFYHNYPVGSDSGGKLWTGFITISLVCMMVAQFTLTGILLLQNEAYALPFMGPLIACSFGFIYSINIKHYHVTNCLPTKDCVIIDRERLKDGQSDIDFWKGKYIQPCLQNKTLVPE